MRKLELWLIRHGQTLVNTGAWSEKPAETSLTSLGREQAIQAAAEIIQKPDSFIVSPLSRAKETAQYLLNKWPDTSYQIKPIQELIYLSPSRLKHLDSHQRKEEVQLYWQKNDPYYTDGSDAESFASFLQRVGDFYTEIRKQSGFMVVIGHGQFLKAFQLGLAQGFTLNPDWMSLFRQQELSNPMKNGDILKLSL